MAEPDNDLPNFEEFDLPGGDIPPMESAEAESHGEAGLVDFTAAEEHVPGEEPAPGETHEPASAEAEAAEPIAHREAKEEGEAEKEEGEQEDHEKEEAKEGEGEEEEKPKRKSLVERLETINPYSVMLGLAVLALLIGILCLYLELRLYNFDTKAEEAKNLVMASPTAPFGPTAIG